MGTGSILVSMERAARVAKTCAGKRWRERAGRPHAPSGQVSACRHAPTGHGRREDGGRMAGGGRLLPPGAEAFLWWAVTISSSRIHEVMCVTYLRKKVRR